MEVNAATRLLIVGDPQEHHVGAHFLAAAKTLGITAEIMDVRNSWTANRWVNRIFFHLGRHHPARLRQFDAEVQSTCQRFKPQMLLVTGISAPSAGALQNLGKMGVCRCNYLTDDPWNPKNGAAFFEKALRHYDAIYSPRRSNMGDLERHGCKRVSYLPFGYNPALHFPEPPKTPLEQKAFCCDVAIVGGGDEDRIPLALALAKAELKLHLYGGYWDRHPVLRPYWKGFVHGRELRMAVSGATVNIGMVRTANRDGNAMRSLEFPAMGACLVVVDTPEHRELLGNSGDCVEYYASVEEMVGKTKALCAQPDRARLLGSRVFTRVCLTSQHTYADRLGQILDDIGKIDAND